MKKSGDLNSLGVEKAEFICAMRMVASSVTVVTTDGPAGRHGATVSAFSSVSADPPTVLICLHADSRISQLVTENGTLCVNVLSSGSQAIARRFAGQDDHLVSDRFSGISWHGCPGTPPEIDGATIFSGHVDQAVTAGSHRIFICRVDLVRTSSTSPLAYFDGAYHSVIPQGVLNVTNTPKHRMKRLRNVTI